MKIEKFDLESVLSQLRSRAADSHKGDYGRLMIIAGARGYTGAPYLAAMGALRSGAGLVYLCVPESIYTIEAVKLNEAIVLPMPEDAGCFSDAALPKILELSKSMDAILIGPGLGRTEGVRKLVLGVLQNCQIPVVLDADGINAVGAHKDVLRDRTAQTILTPHEGEFSRFTQAAITDRIADACSAAVDTHCIMLLKGHETVITDGEQMYLNDTGNPGMAVGGSGDLLAGVILGLLGQGIDPIAAAAAGAKLHGMAGDTCAEQLGVCGMLPTDMLEVLPRLFK